MIDPKDVTIIIPHLGETKEQEFSLNQCLESLKETVPEIRIIVVKNGVSGDFDYCRHEADIQINEQGQCKAVNAAAATVNTPWIFVTNDDMVYPPGWFEKLINPKGQLLTSDGHGEFDWKKAEFLCLSPQLVEPRQGAPTFIEYFCGGAGGDFDKQKFINFVFGHKGDDILTGFNLPFLIKKELWDTIGGYDINYDPWGSNSDSDLEYKIKLAGVQPYQNEMCLVYHFSQTSGTFEPRNQEYWQRNWDYFIHKWGFPRTDDGIWEATFFIPSAEEGRKFNPVWEGKYGS